MPLTIRIVLYTVGVSFAFAFGFGLSVFFGQFESIGAFSACKSISFCAHSPQTSS